jgi:hypothetical protein
MRVDGMMVADSILAELMVANCAVAVMDFMFARARFLRYPNLASNSEFRRSEGREIAEKERAALRPEPGDLGLKKGRIVNKNRQKTTRIFDGFVDSKRVKCVN